MIKQVSAKRLPAGLLRLRWMLFGLTFIHLVVATWLFASSLPVNSWLARGTLVPLFAVLFGLIAYSFWMAAVGWVQRFVLRRNRTKTGASTAVWRSRLRSAQTAILVPVYNESPEDVYAGVIAMRRSLIDRCGNHEYAFFILSDTTKPEVAAEEEQMWARVVEGEQHRIPIYYRRRLQNIGRKAGNLEDFCVRWGSQFDYMVVLDADSLMDGSTIESMVERMESNPRLGILQVPPVPVSRMTWFARLQQFAAACYGPVFTAGLKAWTGPESNYWGHNAIIRVAPFMEHCGLPLLPGVAPLGGEILSHDFVEAALMLRGGFEVELASDLQGSYEECPTNLLDYVIRDQRWCQGNLQHGRLVISEGFHPTSRFHMLMGVLSYSSSLLWLVFLVGLFAVTWAHPESVPPFKVLGISPSAFVFAMTILMLVLPKIWGAIDTMRHARSSFARRNPLRFFASVGCETLVSCLLAPTMMIFHSRFVWNTLRGKKIVWNRQNRDENVLDWSTAVKHFGPISVLGLVTTMAVLSLLPIQGWWFLPITIGWSCAVPLAVWTSSVEAGKLTRRWGWFLIPEEVDVPSVIQFKKSALSQLQNLPRSTHDAISKT